MCVCVCLLPWHKSLVLSRGLVLLSSSVSVCRGEVFYTDDRANGERREKVSHARVMWDGQKNKCCGIEGQRAACASCEYVERLGGGEGKGCVEAFSSHNLHLCRACYSLPKICFCEIYSVIQCWKNNAAHIMSLHAVLSLLHTAYPIHMNEFTWKLETQCLFGHFVSNMNTFGSVMGYIFCSVYMQHGF